MLVKWRSEDGGGGGGEKKKKEKGGGGGRGGEPPPGVPLLKKQGKGQSLHQQKLLSPTENSAPETPLH